jgi:hypothetical protein
MRPLHALGLAAAVLTASLVGLDAQRGDAFPESRDHAAIGYTAGTLDNRVETLNSELRSGARTLAFDPVSGYLPAILDALGLSTESQVLVFSETSLQADRIHVGNPRAVYFDDTVYVGWVRGAETLEVAVQDPRQGAVFYQLPQASDGPSQFTRDEECLICHLTWDTYAVPGLLMHSTAPRATEMEYATGFPTDHRSPFVQRWGGWFVTGNAGGAVHMGNVPVAPDDLGRLALDDPRAALASVDGLFDTAGFPSLHRDVVALLVLAHQTHATNLMTRVGWEARVAEAAGATEPGERVRAATRDLVDYLLFADEAPLPGAVAGSSRFADVFAAAGPRDTAGRSLRDLNLEDRLLAYRCSYMIYAPAFDALPATAREAVYARLWAVLTGAADDSRTALPADERQAIVEILRDTKAGLPPYFFDPIS